MIRNEVNNALLTNSMRHVRLMCTNNMDNPLITCCYCCTRVGVNDFGLSQAQLNELGVGTEG